MALMSPAVKPPRRIQLAWVFPILLLCFAYGLLGLTFISSPAGGMAATMDRCVLMNPNQSRIWSVAHVEISLSYFGIFGAMVFYFLRMYGKDRQHLTDLGLALGYILFSFLLDFACVTHLQPLPALVVGDAVVITFTVIISKQLWFQRLLGVFVPLVFFTCGFGHMMEGMSYWKLTYPVNVPWTMVTADIGFAILINAVRFPAFIRGQDVVAELEQAKAEALTRQMFFRDVLLSVTEGRLHLCHASDELPARLSQIGASFSLAQSSLSAVRHAVLAAGRERGFSEAHLDCLQTAVSEAAMNAMVHGGGGEVSLCANDTTLQVWIADHGSGIQMAQLPRATLERGFSTANTLGHGFWLILRMVDRLDLLTSAQGTTAALALSRDSAVPSLTA